MRPPILLPIFLLAASTTTAIQTNTPSTNFPTSTASNGTSASTLTPVGIRPVPQGAGASTTLSTFTSGSFTGVTILTGGLGGTGSASSTASASGSGGGSGSGSSSASASSSTYSPGSPGNAQQTGVSQSQGGSAAAVGMEMPPQVVYAGLALLGVGAAFAM
ncbi:hypothetical protein B0A55_10418 [Friedmanniomyces simplex]|uniref:REJ domain-containing protein n=1 Tax=Friedmanniomyces simplex TaxID=329884 RepID=A0A4U0WP60_9PEZI|nr:hypothetical protein B0A55_10418 [Friedmanniomyces simplex]